MREIVTVQVGGFANFVGCHFWNFQDELLGLAGEPGADPVFKTAPPDIDVLYRAGETRQGVFTYFPRLISTGGRGSLGSLSSSGSLDADTSAATMDVATWTGNVTRTVAKPHERNLFLQSLAGEEQNSSFMDKGPSNGENSSQKRVEDKDLVECLESGVNFWTDYSKVQYHPHSLYELNGSWTDFDKFDNYGAGREVVLEWSDKEEMNERLRFFVEECDHMQGIQFIVDDSGGFSSIAVEYLENIADDYTNTPVLLYSARDPASHAYTRNQRKSITRALHDAVSFTKLSSFCNLMVPIGLPSLSRSCFSHLLRVKDEKLFHSSAVCAASIHSISVPLRLQHVGPSSSLAHSSGNLDVGELIHILSDQARQNMVTILDVAMPAPSLTDKDELGTIQMSLHPLTPEINNDDQDIYAVESLIVHGALDSVVGGCRASILQVKNSICSAYEGRVMKPKFSHLSVSQCPLPIPLPFPSIFGGSIGQRGEILSSHSDGTPPKGSLEIDSIPMAARLRSSSAIVPFIERRSVSLQKHGIARGARGSQVLRDWGFGKEEIEDMGEHLSKMLRAFYPETELTSDSD